MNSTLSDAWMDKPWKIRCITVEDALPIRHRVLWPNKNMEECRLEDDENGAHFGVFINDTLVCVASVFVAEIFNAALFNKTQHTARLRKFATIEEYQNKGIGRFVLRHIMALMQQQSVSVFWCDAREHAMSLYECCGMSAQGERFFKGGIPYRKMSVILPVSL
ncbi:GNAT family N-acetyltransferase [Marinomonas profundimaris]|uniref:GNAT family acetyltransferase n=1 Tax=Marinomonas profundimaris TaxID=1208321 RepID=W1RZT6_9GAMM|nr:GNAT family N-acetyltransferase [Marinomonas profundimaris]ETI62290.1 GNAT family acetyltransferase [Marinomonas profundimaris]